jgi:hypothetical protein
LCLLVAIGAGVPLGACSSSSTISRDAGDGGGRDERGPDGPGEDAEDDRAPGMDGGGAGADGRDGAAGSTAGTSAAGTAADGGQDAGGDAASSDGKVDLGPTSLTKVVTVPGSANILGAGHTALPPDPAGPGHEGMFPVLVELPAGNGRTMTVTSVSGTIDIDSAGTVPPIPADGFVFTATPIAGPSIGGLRVATADRHAYLGGVFLDDAEPHEPGPASYVVNATASTISGVTVGQLFFIGDGLDGATPESGDVQMFRVPDGATRLFLGFLDGDYLDNLGAITATVRVAR